MAIALVQTAALGSNGGGTSQQTSAFAANPTVGNYIVAWAWGWSGTTGAGTTFTFSDTGGNTYTVPANAKQFSANDLWSVVGYAKVATSGASFKVTMTETATGSSIMVVAAEFSGVASASPLDGAAVGATSSSGSPAPGSLAITAGSLVAAVMAIDSTTFAGSTPAGFTRAAFQNNGSTFEVGEAVYAIGPTSPSNPTWTGGFRWTASQFALLAATGGPAFLAEPPLIVPQAVRRASTY